MKTKHDLDFYKARFQTVVKFLTLRAIYEKFKTLENYRRATGQRKAYCLHIDDGIIKKLTHVRIDGKDQFIFEQIIQDFPGLKAYHRHCHKTYKSGKRYAYNSWYELDDGFLEKEFGDVTTSTCGFMTREAHKFIDDKIYYKKRVEKKARADFKPGKKQEKEAMKKTPEYDDIPAVENPPAPPNWLTPKFIKDALGEGLLTRNAAREIVERLSRRFEIPKLERKVRRWEQGLSYAKSSVLLLEMLSRYGGPIVKALLEDARRELREWLEMRAEIQIKGNDKGKTT